MTELFPVARTAAIFSTRSYLRILIKSPWKERAVLQEMEWGFGG